MDVKIISNNINISFHSSALFVTKLETVTFGRNLRWDTNRKSKLEWIRIKSFFTISIVPFAGGQNGIYKFLYRDLAQFVNLTVHSGLRSDSLEINSF